MRKVSEKRNIEQKLIPLLQDNPHSSPAQRTNRPLLLLTMMLWIFNVLSWLFVYFSTLCFNCILASGSIQFWVVIWARFQSSVKNALNWFLQQIKISILCSLSNLLVLLDLKWHYSLTISSCPSSGANIKMTCFSLWWFKKNISWNVHILSSLIALC